MTKILVKVERYLQIGMIVVCFAALGWGPYEMARYLTNASRFEVTKFSVSGLKRVGENEVLAQAGFELGTNVFTANLSEIRERVEQLQWVRYALVERVLPDQIIVKVVEREPIGIARIRGEAYQFDIDARILDPDPVSGSSFPILDGLRADDSQGNIKKVEAYRKVLEELGQTALSEVHIDKAGEVSVVSASDPVVVNLGSSDFRSQWIKYLQLKSQIQQRYPQAVRVDLRFKNQIIVRMKDDDSGEKIVWGVKKKTL
jgi:cell division protein FtsQ